MMARHEASKSGFFLQQFLKYPTEISVITLDGDYLTVPFDTYTNLTIANYPLFVALPNKEMAHLRGPLI